MLKDGLVLHMVKGVSLYLYVVVDSYINILQTVAVKATCEQSCEQTSNAFIQGGLNRLKIGLGHEHFALIMSAGVCCNFVTAFLIILFHVFH